MARKAKQLKRERFSLNTSPSIAKLLRAAARNDNRSISHYLESALLESLSKGRSFDDMGMLQETIGQEKT